MFIVFHMFSLVADPRFDNFVVLTVIPEPRYRYSSTTQRQPRVVFCETCVLNCADLDRRVLIRLSLLQFQTGSF